MQQIRLLVVLAGFIGAGSSVLCPAPAVAALEMRGPDGDVRYVGELTRAFVPCVAPNDVTPVGYKIKLTARDVDVSAADLPGVNLVISVPTPNGFVTTTAQRNRLCRIGKSSRSCK